MSPIAQRELGREWTFADYSDFVVGIAAACLISGFVGYGIAKSHYEQRIAEIAAQPKRVGPLPATALTQWNCTKQEFREYRHACAQRAQSSLIEQINPRTKGKL